MDSIKNNAFQDLLPPAIYAYFCKAFDHVEFPEKFIQTLQQKLMHFKSSASSFCYASVIKQELKNSQLTHVLKKFEMFEKFQKDVGPQKKINKNTTISCTQTIEEYIDRADWRINSNANVGFSSVGLVNQSAGKIIANYWLDCVYSKEAGEAHRNADLHIHDLDCLTGYCAGWSLRLLLNEGFNGIPGHVASSAPKHLREALGQMFNFLGILQAEWAGAQAFSSFDTYLAPYVFKDNLAFKEVKKAIRYFIYNINVPTRGGQSPFTNVTLDFTCPKDLQDQIPLHNNRHLFEGLQDKKLLARVKARGLSSLEELTYKDFQPEIELICAAYYEVMTEGDSLSQPFTFPLTTVNITDTFNWDSVAAEKLFENTAKHGTSYFQNFVGSQWIEDAQGNRIPNPEAYTPDAVRSMCCRLLLDLKELLKRGNGLFGSAEMTGSIGVVTLNMARLGYRFRENKEALFQELATLMERAKDTLEKKRVFIQDMYNRGLYPYTRRYLKGFHNHFSTIGINGINEMLLNYSGGKTDISSAEGIDFCIEIIEFMNTRLKQYQKETGNLYNLEATPAEGATYRFAKEDKKRFSDILQAGSGENIYYTNSSQLPAYFTDDPYCALEKQDRLQCKYTGGTTLHIYTGEKISSAEACKHFVKSIVTNYKLPSITISPVFSTCMDHGYISGEHTKCPTCGKDTLVWTRVMGYYRPVCSFNLGKKGEHAERKFFNEPDSIHQKRMQWNEQLSLSV